MWNVHPSLCCSTTMYLLAYHASLLTYHHHLEVYTSAAIGLSKRAKGGISENRESGNV